MPARKKEIVEKYIDALHQHIHDLKQGHADRVAEIRDFAEMLHIHPRHLSNTIQEVLHRSPCSLYEEQLVKISKELLVEEDQSIARIARHLNYDPSNFTKFFKHYTGMTPGEFRKQQEAKTETLTMNR